MNLEAQLIGSITVGMAITFALGIIVLVSFMWMKAEEERSGYTTKRFLRPTGKNILFHIVSSLLVLLVLHEVSQVLIEKFIPELRGDETYHMTMAGLTGMFGSVLVGYLLEKWAKQRNIVDKEIAHTAKPELDKK